MNVCSRIERLTKKYRCPLLISEETLIEAARIGMSFDGWHHFIDEEVRGISGEMRLAAPRDSDLQKVA